MLKKYDPLRFRKPSNKEKELIASYIWKTEIRNTHIIMNIGFIFCLMVIILIMLNFWMNSRTLSVKDNIAFTAVLTAASWCTVYTQRIRHTKKVLWKRIERGEYKVADCRSYYIKFPHLFFRKEVAIKYSNDSSLLLHCGDFCKAIPKKLETDSSSKSKI